MKNGVRAWENQQNNQKPTDTACNSWRGFCGISKHFSGFEFFCSRTEAMPALQPLKQTVRRRLRRSDMVDHDRYGKQVLAKAARSSYTSTGSSIEIDFGVGMPARIDGTVGNSIAVEVESRTSKQVRGAVLDLLCHQYPKKLLVILPVHMQNPKITAQQCERILGRFIEASTFRVIVLEGSGFEPKIETDAALVLRALQELGFSST